jgi:hypothetical protein
VIDAPSARCSAPFDTCVASSFERLGADASLFPFFLSPNRTVDLLHPNHECASGPQPGRRLKDRMGLVGALEAEKEGSAPRRRTGERNQTAEPLRSGRKEGDQSR